MSASSPAWRLRSLSILRSALRATLILLATLSLLLALVFASGCTRTVLVPESSPVRIGPGARARVYALVDGEWILSDNAVDLEEGWYMVPPSFVDR